MKKSILILILAELLTACAGVTPDTDHGEEHLESSLNSAPFSENNTESESYAEIETQLSTECEIPTTETTVTTEATSETVCTTTAVTDVQKEKYSQKFICSSNPVRIIMLSLGTFLVNKLIYRFVFRLIQNKNFGYLKKNFS